MKANIILPSIYPNNMYLKSLRIWFYKRFNDYPLARSYKNNSGIRSRAQADGAGEIPLKRNGVLCL